MDGKIAKVWTIGVFFAAIMMAAFFATLAFSVPADGDVKDPLKTPAPPEPANLLREVNDGRFKVSRVLLGRINGGVDIVLFIYKDTQSGCEYFSHKGTALTLNPKSCL